MLRVLLLWSLLVAVPSHARQDVAPVHKAVEAYLEVQSRGLPGKPSFTVGRIDPNNQLAPCRSFDVAHAPGAKPWGRTTVVVRCIADVSWQLFVPVQVRILIDYLVPTRAITPGQTIVVGDLATQSGDLSELPTGTLIDPVQAIGRAAAMLIPAGKPLRSDMLRQHWLVQQGQSVKVISKGPGFEVANEGKALASGVEGQILQIRLTNGQIVSGIVRASGYVEISF